MDGMDRMDADAVRTCGDHAFQSTQSTTSTTSTGPPAGYALLHLGNRSGRSAPETVIPAKAGIQNAMAAPQERRWIPAFAGITPFSAVSGNT